MIVFIFYTHHFGCYIGNKLKKDKQGSRLVDLNLQGSSALWRKESDSGWTGRQHRTCQ